MLKYHFEGEQGGTYLFKHCNEQYDALVCREAKPVLVSLIVTMKEITATTMAGTTAIEYSRKDDEGMRVITLREMIHKQMSERNQMSVVQPLKLLRAIVYCVVTLPSGSVGSLIRGMTRARNKLSSRSSFVATSNRSDIASDSRTEDV